MSTSQRCATGLVAAMLLAAIPLAHAAVRVTLKTGFSYDCVREEALDQKTVRLFLYPHTAQQTSAASLNYIDVASNRIAEIEGIADPATPTDTTAANPATSELSHAAAPATALTPAEMHELLASAGQQHHIDEDLLASVVKAESGGHPLAISRTGARGLMQLMPATANDLGVNDAFAPAQNIAGGTAYLDQMLTRYHDNLAWALAAYNAGPAAVDRYHGIPPYRETQAYVARVIREFNRRKHASLIAASHDSRRGF